MAKNLIIYFSRADKNYSVGYIDKGNTEIAAEFVRDLISYRTKPKNYFRIIPNKQQAAP